MGDGKVQQVAAGSVHTVLLRHDGLVLTFGDAQDPSCRMVEVIHPEQDIYQFGR